MEAMNLDLLIPNRKGESPIVTLDSLQQTFQLTREIIDDLTPEALNQLMNSAGGEADIDLMFDSILNEVYSVLYGNTGTKIQAANLGYLDKFADSVEETMRCDNFSYFITSVMPDFEMNWHHLQWCDIAMTVKWFCILAARDHSKSFTFSNAYPAWKMYRYDRFANDINRDFMSRTHRDGYIFSFSIQQAIDLLAILKDNIETNDILKERLRPNGNDSWNKTEIVTKNGARLRVKGFGSSVRGAHPGWIIVDDGLKDNVMYSELQRKKSIDYFQSVIMNMPVPKGGVGVVGTPFHSLDLYGSLATLPRWKVFHYPAIFPDGKILWSNRYTYDDLIAKRETQGSLIFSREILVKPVTSDSTIFPIEILNNAFIRMENYKLVNNIESFPIKFQRVVAGCDFAMSSAVGADYSVFTVWGIDEQDRMWLLYLYRQKGKTFAEQMAQLKYIKASFRPDWMVLEKNQFQQIFVEESEKAGLPVVPHSTGMNKYDFLRGLPGLALMFERGKIKIPTGDQHSQDVRDILIQEFTSIAYTDKGLQSVDGHDDSVIATWLGAEGMRLVTTGAFKFAFV